MNDLRELVDIEKYNYCVGVYSKPIGKSWV